MRYLFSIACLALFSCYSISEPLKIATSSNLQLLNKNYQLMLEAAIINAGYQVDFIEHKNANTLNESNSGKLDGELYRYSYTMQDYNHLVMIPVKLNSSALFVYVPQKSSCPEFQQLTNYTPIGVIGVTYFDKLYETSQAGFIEQTSITRAIESLIKEPLSFTVFPDDIAPALMELTGAKLKRCYQKPLLVLSAYSYLHQKHTDKIDAISRELKTLLLTR